MAPFLEVVFSPLLTSYLFYPGHAQTFGSEILRDTNFQAECQRQGRSGVGDRRAFLKTVAFPGSGKDSCQIKTFVPLKATSLEGVFLQLT